MSQPKRFSVAVDDPWFGDGAYITEDGKYVLWADYAALLAENERLRKAGDAMYNAAVQDSTGLWLLNPFQDWHKMNHPRTEGGAK